MIGCINSILYHPVTFKFYYLTWTCEQKEEIPQCSYNTTLCEIKTDCHAKSLVSSWVHDCYCDNFCNHEYCHFDGSK